MQYFRGLIIWIGIIFAETIHGILREALLAPLIGSFPARRVAVFTGMVVIFLVAYLGIRWIGSRTVTGLLSIGAMWIVLTVVFEIVLGRIALGLSWARLLEDYDLTRGGLMGLGLLFVLFSPLLAAKLRFEGGITGLSDKQRGAS